MDYVRRFYHVITIQAHSKRLRGDKGLQHLIAVEVSTVQPDHI